MSLKYIDLTLSFKESNFAGDMTLQTEIVRLELPNGEITSVYMYRAELHRLLNLALDNLQLDYDRYANDD